MESILTEILEKYDGIVLGGNDFLYTKELSSHPMSYFVYEYGRLLQKLGVDTIYLENHYINEPLQTRGLIGHVMYCAYLYNLRVIGIEGKFKPEEYKIYTGKDINETWTTVSFETHTRIERLNIITKDIVEYTKKGKFLLFCGMSHVNDETDVTTCKGMKNLLNVPGIGCHFSNIDNITPKKPFRDMGYERPTDYLLELKSNTLSNDRLYIDATIWCMVHDYLFFYKTVYNVVHQLGKKNNIHRQCISVKMLWKDKATVYPPMYKLYMNDMIQIDNRLWLPDNELDDLCAYLHHIIYKKKYIISRSQLVELCSGFTDNNLDDIIDEWIIWLKRLVHKKVLNEVELTALSDIIFLEYKKLSTEREIDRYILYLKNKYRKQLERPEHKIFTLITIMKSLNIPYPHFNLIDKVL
jgi:hypothetical protein